MNSELNSILAHINAEKRLRVWSVILTFFGDAIVTRGGTVSAQSVSQIMQSLGIEDGAVRTAFSRLTKDGWVTRKKMGRSSFYSLAEKGYEPFAKATTQIYAIPNYDDKPHENWILATASSDGKERLKAIADENHALMMDAHIVVFAKFDDELIIKLEKANCLITQGADYSVPAWIKDNETLKQLKSEFENFIVNFKALPTNLSPLDAMAARCLLIHEWRRLILKMPNVPTALLPVAMPEDWPSVACAHMVADKYKALIEASESWLDDKSVTSEEFIKADKSVMKRFNTLQK